MFEKPASFRAAAPLSSDSGEGDVRPAGLRRGETALKAIEWCDLAARLEAARDLRLALRHDARRHIEDTAASFSDAAAQYFRMLEQSKQPVNLAALEEHKGSGPIVLAEGCHDVQRGLHAGFGRDDAKDEQ